MNRNQTLLDYLTKHLKDRDLHLGAQVRTKRLRERFEIGELNTGHKILLLKEQKRTQDGFVVAVETVANAARVKRFLFLGRRK